VEILIARQSTSLSSEGDWPNKLKTRTEVLGRPVSAKPLLSLAMIVRDEEDTLAGALEDARHFCDELIVVDTGSVDGTIEIARTFGAKVFHFDWIDDFAAARNFSFAQASGSWILWLDADDRIVPAAWPGMRVIIDDLPHLTNFDFIVLAYNYKFSEVDPSVCLFTGPRERFIRNSPDIRWVGRIHENVPIVPGRALSRTDAWVEHRPSKGHSDASAQRNLRVIVQCLEDGDDSPWMLHYYADNLTRLGRHEEAFATYEKILSIPGDSSTNVNDLRYLTLDMMAESAAALGMVDKELDCLGRAIVFNSGRAEAFIHLGRHFYEKKEWRKAIPFFYAATTLQAPVLGPVNPSHYSWLPWDYLAICAGEIGDFRSALEYCTRALPGHPEKDRIVANMALYAKHL
jgi:glycosyltransferase involved in cell wall biosynthesis